LVRHKIGSRAIGFGSLDEEKKMPLSKKGKSILAAMKKTYGKIRGKKVFYASAKKKTIKGVH